MLGFCSFFLVLSVLLKYDFFHNFDQVRQTKWQMVSYLSGILALLQSTYLKDVFIWILL